MDGKSISVYKKKRGRPASGHLPLISGRIPQELIDFVDDYRKEEALASRSESLRKLLELVKEMKAKRPHAASMRVEDVK